MPHVADVVISSAQVDADLTDFVVYVDLSDLPTTEFWGTVANGGGDIRVFKSDGTTELAREVVSCDTATDTGELHVKFSGVLSGTANTTIQIHADGSSADYAVTATHGRNAVWSDYHYVGHLESDGTDSTGNNTASGGSSTDVTGELGGKQEFSFGGPPYTVPGSYTLPLTMQGWTESELTGLSNFRTVSLGNSGSNSEQINLGGVIDSGIRYFIGENSGTTAIGPHAVANVPALLHGVLRSESERLLYVDGGFAASSTGTIGFSGLNRFAIGASADATPFTQPHQADEVRIRYSELTADWISTENRNQSAPATLYSVGVPAPAPAGDIVQSIAGYGGIAGPGGIAGRSGGIAG